MNETVNQETNGTAPAEQEKRTFTQAEMNAIIADRLNRERSKYADYDDLKAKAAQAEAIEAAGQAELAKAQRRADELQKQLDGIAKADTLRNIRQAVAEQTGVPADLLTGETEADCKAQAQKILDFTGPKYPVVPDGGTSGLYGRIGCVDDGLYSAFDRENKHKPKAFPPASLFY